MTTTYQRGSDLFIALTNSNTGIPTGCQGSTRVYSHSSTVVGRKLRRIYSRKTKDMGYPSSTQNQNIHVAKTKAKNQHFRYMYKNLNLYAIFFCITMAEACS